MGIFTLITGIAGPSGFGSASTAEQVTQGIDAANLTAIVTGGASGIGLETARVLALRKAHVIIAARNIDAANEAKQIILKDQETARVDVLKLDLCSIKSIRAFADSFKALNLPLNILINNAGIMFCPYQLSENGVEIQFATNHLGHFLLTNLLLDKMKDTAKSTGVEGRIVNLSSIAHQHTYGEGISFFIWNLFQSWIFIFRLLFHFSPCALSVLVLSLSLTAYNRNLQVLQGSTIYMNHN